MMLRLKYFCTSGLLHYNNIWQLILYVTICSFLFVSAKLGQILTTLLLNALYWVIAHLVVDLE